LDSLPEYRDSGIINDFTLTISRETLIGQHGFTDPSEASLGFHPIEYYAFARPIEDFVPTTLESLEADVTDRRRQLVMIVTTELANNVETLVDDLTRTAITTLSLSPAQRLKAIIAGARRSALSGFQQANLIVDSDQGHCQYSKSSLENLRYETQTLRAIFASDSTLLSILAGIRPETTRNLDNTLDQAVTILTDPQPSEADRAKLPLMLSAISHQLEEFELELTHQRDSR
ncbi:MAG: imelysin family protein, partial [Pseudomonadales bacterium]